MNTLLRQISINDTGQVGRSSKIELFCFNKSWVIAKAIFLLHLAKAKSKWEKFFSGVLLFDSRGSGCRLLFRSRWRRGKIREWRPRRKGVWRLVWSRSFQNKWEPTRTRPSRSQGKSRLADDCFVLRPWWGLNVLALVVGFWKLCSFPETDAP